MDDNEVSKLNISLCSDSHSSKSATELFISDNSPEDECREDETIDKLVVSFDDIELMEHENQIRIETPRQSRGNYNQQNIV